jgi:hypothetical protein
MSVTYSATLTVREETVLFVSRLLNAERRRRATRTGTRGAFAAIVPGLQVETGQDLPRLARGEVPAVLGACPRSSPCQQRVDAAWRLRPA